VSSSDSFGARSQLEVDGTSYEIFRLDAVEGHDRLPYSLKILLENLLRTEDGTNTTADDVRALAAWDPTADPVDRDPVHARARHPAGLHRRAGRRRPRRDAGGDARARR
jgi:aconitase A